MAKTPNETALEYYSGLFDDFGDLAGAVRSSAARAQPSPHVRGRHTWVGGWVVTPPDLMKGGSWFGGFSLPERLPLG